MFNTIGWRKAQSSMFTIVRKEINSFLSSLVGYIVIAVFLTASGLFFWVFPNTSVLEYGFAEMSTFFNYTPFIFIFLVPAITMRAISEELKAGTIELLLTKPITKTQLILGKYTAAVLLLGLTLLPTIVYYLSVYQLGNPAGNIDSAAVGGSYLGLVLIGGVFAAVGIYTSSLTDSQIVAFLLSVFVCFVLFVGLSSLAALDVWGEMGYFLAQIGLDYHYYALGRGLIDTRNVLYLLTLIIFFLLLTQQRLKLK